MSWVAVAIGATAVGSGVVGAVGANQNKQKNKGTISEAYRIAQQRMGASQNEGTQNNLETLNARGLAGGGTATSPIQAAMANGRTPGATDIASASRSRLAGEYKLDKRSLDNSYTQAQNQNKADALNTEIGSVAGGIQGVAGAVGLHNEMGATNAATQRAKTPIASAMLSGGSWEGVHPVDPLGDPSSSWHLPDGLTMDGSGLRNSDFNTSGVG